MRQIQVTKIRLEHQMDNLDVADSYYDRKIVDLQRRYDEQYDKAGEIEAQTKELSGQIFNIRQEKESICSTIVLPALFLNLWRITTQIPKCLTTDSYPPTHTYYLKSE